MPCKFLHPNTNYYFTPSPLLRFNNNIEKKARAKNITDFIITSRRR